MNAGNLLLYQRRAFSGVCRRVRGLSQRPLVAVGHGTVERRCSNLAGRVIPSRETSGHSPCQFAEEPAFLKDVQLEDHRQLCSMYIEGIHSLATQPMSIIRKRKLAESLAHSILIPDLPSGTKVQLFELLFQQMTAHFTPEMVMFEFGVTRHFLCSYYIQGFLDFAAKALKSLPLNHRCEIFVNNTLNVVYLATQHTHTVTPALAEAFLSSQQTITTHCHRLCPMTTLKTLSALSWHKDIETLRALTPMVRALLANVRERKNFFAVGFDHALTVRAAGHACRLLTRLRIQDRHFAEQLAPFIGKVKGDLLATFLLFDAVICAVYMLTLSQHYYQAVVRWVVHNRIRYHSTEHMIELLWSCLQESVPPPNALLKDLRQSLTDKDALTSLSSRPTGEREWAREYARPLLQVLPFLGQGSDMVEIALGVLHGSGIALDADAESLLNSVCPEAVANVLTAHGPLAAVLLLDLESSAVRRWPTDVIAPNALQPNVIQRLEGVPVACILTNEYDWFETVEGERVWSGAVDRLYIGLLQWGWRVAVVDGVPFADDAAGNQALVEAVLSEMKAPTF